MLRRIHPTPEGVGFLLAHSKDSFRYENFIPFNSINSISYNSYFKALKISGGYKVEVFDGNILLKKYNLNKESNYEYVITMYYDDLPAFLIINKCYIE